MDTRVLDEVYFSVDGEFSGPYPPTYYMLSLGAVAFTLRKGILGEFSVNFLPITGSVMSPQTKNGFWDRFPEAYAATQVDQVHPADGMRQFKEFYHQHAQDRAGVFLEFPGPSDFFWSHWYFEHFLGEDPFGHSGQLGLKTYVSAVLKRPLRHSTKRNMRKRWFASKLPHTHIALDDAREQGHMAIRIMCEHLEVELPPL